MIWYFVLFCSVLTSLLYFQTAVWSSIDTQGAWPKRRRPSRVWSTRKSTWSSPCQIILRISYGTLHSHELASSLRLTCHIYICLTTSYNVLSCHVLSWLAWLVLRFCYSVNAMFDVKKRIPLCPSNSIWIISESIRLDNAIGKYVCALLLDNDAHTLTLTHIYSHACIRTYTHTFIQRHTNIDTRAQTHTHIYACTQKQVCVRAYSLTYTQTHMHAHSNLLTHTHSHCLVSSPCPLGRKHLIWN